MRYFLFAALAATLLAACGGSPASTGGAAPASAPAAPTRPAAPTQPPEATAPPAVPTQPPAATAPAPTTVPTAPPAAATAVRPGSGDAEVPAGEMQGVMVIFKRTGGIAGIEETLTVYEDGRVALVGRDSESTVQVAPDELSELRRLLATPEFAALDGRYPALGADLFTYTITTSTGGRPRTVVTMDGAKNPPILDQVLAELGKLMQAQTR